MEREKQSIKGVIPLEEAYTKLRAIQNFLYEKSGGKAYVNSFEPANKPQKVYLEDGITVQRKSVRSFSIFTVVDSLWGINVPVIH